MNQGTSLGSQVGRWILLAALVVALGALLLTIRPAGAQSNAPISVDYPENADHAVGRVYATDPEGKGLNWSLSGADGPEDDTRTGDETDQFDISDTGVLTFKSPPDFESPGDDGTNNIYNVKVTVTDAKGAMSTAQDYIITVTNVNEDGMVMLSGLQPRDGVEITATLTDEDTVVGLVDWQWASSSSMNGAYTDIADATNATYTPVAADVGRHLRATASYYDRESATTKKSAAMPSHYPVQAALEAGASNRLPSFDQDPGDTADNDPTTTAGSVNTLFELTPSDVDVDLEVAENSPAGTMVGYPVAATDPDEDDKLTYSLADTNAGSGHSAYLAIDRATGQVTVKKSLNFEATDQCGDPNICLVTVTATDSSGVPTAPVTIALTVVVTGVNESPKFIRGNKAVSLNEGIAGTPSVAIDADGDGTDNTYGVEDPETTGTTNLTWSVSGVDGDNFELANTGALTFGETAGPDFEKPADANKDNVYEITLEVSDGTNTAMMDVKVTVNNVQEPTGTVTFSHLQPREGRAFTATLMDPDGSISSASWVWSIAGSPASTPTGTISGATSRTYTPKAGDVGGTLTATVTYTDGADPGQTATADTANTVQASGTNSAPTFAEVLYERTVDENAAADSSVGAVIVATDSDTSDILQYSLTGADSEHFTISNTGQITNTAVLNYEKPADSNRDNVYSFSLVATDSSGSTGTTRVAVSVGNVDTEALTVADGTRTVAENAPAGTAVGDPIEPSDTGDSTSVTYALTGTDAAFFDIHRTTGQITVKKMVNFEATGGAGAEEQCVSANACSVTVTATDPSGADDDNTATITVNVTDVNEAPEFPETVTRYVTENTATDEALGKRVRLNTNGTDAATGGDTDAVVATDPEIRTSPTPPTPAERLLYTLGGPHAMYFDIYKATGQIITKELLDYEALPENKKSYDVTVTATDRAGLSMTKNVTIMVVDVNEPPVIIDGLSVSGPSGMNYEENGTDGIGPYEVQGLNADTAMWSVEGDDAGDFRVNPTSGASVMLMFASSPNFEMAADADGDNVYMVTVKATDPDDSAISDTKDVMVTVTDMDDPASVTGLPASTMIDAELTAMLSDEDMGAMATAWQWSRSATMDGTYADITGATMATYTVAEGDAEMYLKATATYDDKFGMGKMIASDAVMVMPATVAARYDGDGDGMISISELFDAVDAYFNGEITVTELFEVIDAHFANG